MNPGAGDTRRNDLPDSHKTIPLPGGWRSVTRVEKGWSRDRKYRVATARGPDLLLRLNEAAPPEKRRQEFLFVQRLHELGLPVPQAHAFYAPEDGAASWMLLDWQEGRELEEALPGLPPQDQYGLGLEAGWILRGIHSAPRFEGLPLPRDMRERARDKVRRFEEAGIDLPGAREVMDFIRGHLHWLDAHPPVCLHGDFHPGNLVYTPQGRLAVIDFNRFDVGDPVEEFLKLQSFTIEHSLPFARGQLHGYFEGEPEKAFWRSLAVHVAVTALYSVRWARPFGEQEVAGMVARYHRTLNDYSGFSRLIPAWYRPAPGQGAPLSPG